MENEKIAALVEKGLEMPPAPLMATKVLQIVNDPNGTASQLEATIQTDHNLASRVLRMSNSAYYRRLERIKSISAAIKLLGFRAVRNLVLATSTRSFYAPFGEVENRLWDHSVGTATAAALLARRYKVLPADEAMLAGLIHDIGKTIINYVQPDAYREIAERAYHEGRSSFACEQEALGFTHCDVGAPLVIKWNFPMEFGKAIYYHDRMEEVDPERLDPQQLRFIALTDVANRVMHRLGIGVREPATDVDLTALPSLAMLGIRLAPDEVDPLLEQVRTACEEEKAAFA